MKTYIHRALERCIPAASDQFPVLLLTGPRQTGKTTLLTQIKDANRNYVSLDSMPARLLAREDPELFLQKYAPPVIIDEIQYAPELLSAIKLSCDAKREKGMFWLTGSQQFYLMRGVTESLAGRVAIMNLNGLSDREFGGDGVDGESVPDIPFMPVAGIPRRPGRIYDEPAMFDRIFRGSYPALLSGEVADTDLFYSSYVQTYLERDLRELSQVGDLEAFYTFLKVLAARAATTVNMSEISRDCAISVPTVKHWISILVATSLVYLLKPYASNRGSRLIKSPKLYFLDSGLCAHLAGYSSPATLAASPLRGAIFENWCVSEVLKSWWYARKEPPIFYYRDKEGAEIDLLFEADGSLYPAEIKLGVSPRKDWIRNFSVLRKLGLPIKPGNVLCLAREPFPIDRENTALPAGWI